MLTRSLLLLSTLVLSDFAGAAPSPPSSSLNESPPAMQESKDDESKATDILKASGMAITPVKINTKETQKPDFYYPYQQAISPRLVLVANLDLLRQGKLPYGLGFSYLAPSKRPPQWEAGGDLLTDSYGQIFLCRRHISFADTYFRPYYKYGLAHIWKAEEKLASFSNWNNYLLRAGLGFEDVIKLPMSARLEIEVAAGSGGFMIFFSMGYSWGW